MTNDEKHDDCRKRTGHPCVVLPPNLYDRAERRGIDMSDFVRDEPIPLLGAFHNMRMKPGYVANGSIIKRGGYP